MQDELFIKLKKAALVNPAGVTFQAFRKTLTPEWGVVWLHIALGWLALIATNGLIAWLSGVDQLLDGLLLVAGSLLIGFIVAYLQLFFHEAAHYNLHPDQGTNDLLCNLVVSGIVGQEIKQYRPIHWDHHRHLGTPMDTEISYFDPLDTRFLLEALLGIRVLKVNAIRKAKLANMPSKQAVDRATKAPPCTLIGGLLFNAAYIALLLYFRQWVLVLAWTGGILAWFPFFAALRQVLEHRDEHADPTVDYTEVIHGAIHRLFGDGLLASTLGGAGFNRHLLHHWDPQLSYTRLRELENFLMDTAGAAYLRERLTTYGATFRRLFRVAWR